MDARARQPEGPACKRATGRTLVFDRNRIDGTALRRLATRFFRFGRNVLHNHNGHVVVQFENLRTRIAAQSTAGASIFVHKCFHCDLLLVLTAPNPGQLTTRFGRCLLTLKILQAFAQNQALFVPMLRAAFGASGVRRA